MGQLTGNCTNVLVNTTAGEYIKYIRAQHTSTSLYQLTFVTSKGTKTTIGKQYAGTKNTTFEFNDNERRFVGFNGTLSSTRVVSIAPQIYNNTCLVEAFANASKESPANVTETDV